MQVWRGGDSADYNSRFSCSKLFLITNFLGKNGMYIMVHYYVCAMVTAGLLALVTAISSMHVHLSTDHIHLLFPFHANHVFFSQSGLRFFFLIFMALD